MNLASRLLSASALALGLWAASPVQAADFVSIARSSVHMRAGPGTEHDSQWKLSRGYPLEVTGRRGSWLKVRDFENDTGWVYRPLTGRTRHHIVKSDRANVRSGPGTSHRIVGQATYGEIVRTTERRQQWVKVRRADGPSGWISRKLLWGW